MVKIRAIIKGMRKNAKGNSGQVLLVVVVVMVVALTIGLSVASRAITNLKTSKQNEDSQNAFQAASAGVDRYINVANCASNPAACDPTQQSLVSSKFDTKVSEITGATIALNNGNEVDQDRGIDVWFSTYPDFSAPFTGTVEVYWGTSDQIGCTGTGGAVAPALEMVLLSGSKAVPVLTKYVYDRCLTRRSLNFFNNPTSVSLTVADTVYTNRATLTITSGLLMKVIPIYNSTKIAIVRTSGTAIFPPQGKLIESTGTAGDATRKIVYFESYPQIPNEIFPYAILSQ